MTNIDQTHNINTTDIVKQDHARVLLQIAFPQKFKMDSVVETLQNEYGFICQKQINRLGYLIGLAKKSSLKQIKELRMIKSLEFEPILSKPPCKEHVKLYSGVRTGTVLMRYVYICRVCSTMAYEKTYYTPLPDEINTNEFNNLMNYFIDKNENAIKHLESFL